MLIYLYHQIVKIISDKIKNIYAMNIQFLANVVYDKFKTFRHPMDMGILDI